MHWTQTQQLLRHFKLVFNTPDENAKLCFHQARNYVFISIVYEGGGLDSAETATRI